MQILILCFRFQTHLWISNWSFLTHVLMFVFYWRINNYKTMLRILQTLRTEFEKFFEKKWKKYIILIFKLTFKHVLAHCFLESKWKIFTTRFIAEKFSAIKRVVKIFHFDSRKQWAQKVMWRCWGVPKLFRMKNKVILMTF